MHALVLLDFIFLLKNILLTFTLHASCYAVEVQREGLHVQLHNASHLQIRSKEN